MDRYEYSGAALAVAPAKTHLVTTQEKHSALFEAKQADLGQVNRNHFGGFSLATRFGESVATFECASDGRHEETHSDQRDERHRQNDHKKN